MNNIRLIRDRLGITQATLAEALGCTQGNVSLYEQGQTVLPEAAKRMISYAKTLGHDVTFDDIYGDEKASPTDLTETTPATP